MAHRTDPKLRATTYTPWPRDKSKFSHKAAKPVRKTIAFAGDIGSGVGDLQVSRGARGSKVDPALLKRLQQAAQVIADRAKEVSSTFSTRIPGSIKVVTSEETGRVQIKGGGAKAPNAYPFDPPSNPPVRHPLFGNRDYWYAQPYRPFLEEAAEAGGDEAAEALANVIDDWAEELGSSHP